MKVFFAAALCAVMFAPLVVRGQDEHRRTGDDEIESAEPEISLGQLTPTPDMWFYEQARRQYRNPKMAVRRRAEFEADQRQARLAAQRWFGYSNSRPTVSITPFTNTYSPMWTSNSPYAGQWRGVSRTTVVVPSQAARPNGGYGLW